ncbi:MAG TPA: hypothetical protein VEG30_16090 [Terriglobales bacterium]|nr:hypothetical protein [Terriglobales bacterium]
MTTLLLPALQLSAPIPDAVKKKRVLLVDTSQAQREATLSAPPRDSEGRPSKPTPIPTGLDASLREELQ